MITTIPNRFYVWRHKQIVKLNAWLLKKSRLAAIETAKKIFSETGKTVYVFLYKKDFIAVPKQDFKTVWKTYPGMKQRTLAEWKNYVYEVGRNSRKVNTAG